MKKTIGIILIVLQIFALVGMAASGGPFFNGSFANLIGKFIFGIVGAVLLISAAAKKG